MSCFIWGSKNDHKVENQCLLLNEVFVIKKIQKYPLKWKFEEKNKHHVKDFFKILDLMFYFFLQTFILVGVFGICYKGKPYFKCITEEVLRWNLAVKWSKKKKKKIFFVVVAIICNFYSQKDNSCL